MKVESANLTVDPKTFQPVIRAVISIPLSPVVDGLYSEEAALKIGRDFICEMNEIAESGGLGPRIA